MGINFLQCLRHTSRCSIFGGDSRVLKLWLFFFVFICLLLVLSNGEETTNANKLIKIGAIIDIHSSTGREEKTALDIAVQMIIGLEKWEETVVVGNIGTQAQVPVISFAAPAITPPLATARWPFLVRMANEDSKQMKCIAAIIGLLNWKRVIVIYEDDAFGSESGKIALLPEALQDVGSEVEFRLVLPPFSSVTNLNVAVHEELKKLQKKQSRGFVVLHSSFSMTIHLFEEAKKSGLVGHDSAWIVTETISSYLDSFNSSVISSMEGTLGIKIYYSEDTSLYKKFYTNFRTTFRNEYHEEDNSQPGINAFRAYDSIGIITQAVEKLKSDGKSPKKLLKKILSSNFTGASGEVCFEEGQLSYDPILRIVNVNETGYVGEISQDLGGRVYWPGDSKLAPKGWAMPTDEKPSIIGVPAITSFEKFVKVVDGKLPGVKNYDGFCIKLFYEVLKVLGYHLPYRFDSHNGTYDELANKVYNKTYDAAVGDITILANRADHVKFTQPYAWSGLTMIVPAKSKDSAGIFVKLFTIEMWLATAAILIYTVFIVWIGTTLWFAFSSIFFAHREKVYSNLTRMVVVVWLFVVLVLNSSYTASLTSMLTVKRLGPNVTESELLKRANLKIGCDGDSFVRTYLENVLNFKSYNIENVSSEYKYEGEFKSHRIAATFLELPYGKKGSPIAKDFSRAILQFSENGFLLSLEKEWFSPSLECSADVTDSTTSTLCFLFFSMHLLKKYYRHRVENVDESQSVWIKAIRVAKYFYLGDVVLVQREASVAPDPEPDINEWRSPSTLDFGHTNMENLDGTSSPAETEIEMLLQTQN
ncbi:hypothetical protein ES319_D05G164900v1 [Gossypium barbadense]|uniref:Ionotropic glutamate receptor C-terminal domain-containing protein n=1 Tax=Gossypium barbadense TaxID=3634 RepID=A0A5J5RDB1_GOSBA|nr:hypothetical protein ES319_D05G164900v1 [Gossypium barbadense]